MCIILSQNLYIYIDNKHKGYMTNLEETYKNRYRIPSSRLQNWDYGSNGYYFITICTKNREHYFGTINIINPVSEYTISLSKIGDTVSKCWFEIPKFHSYVKLDSFVVMPNHIHGILIIDKPQNKEDAKCCASTKEVKNEFGVQSHNLASIIRGFKAGVKKYATMNNIKFQWQPRYHDHIIRDEKEYLKIKEYIDNNVLYWAKDRYNEN